MDRYKAREKVVEKFEELGLLEKIDDYEMVLPTCERCKTVIEPLLSEQWFCKMDEMRDMALDSLNCEGAPHFSPQVPHEKAYTAVAGKSEGLDNFAPALVGTSNSRVV